MQFGSARLKLDRANVHIAEVNRKINAVVSPEAQTVWVEVDPDTRAKQIHYRLDRFGDLGDVAPILGDAIHNLKCVLDHAWYATLKILDPDAIGTKTKFPVFLTIDKLKTTLAGVIRRDGLIDFIANEIKPYKG